MAEDLSLLVKFRGDNSGLKATTADTRLAVSQLRHSFGTELKGAMTTLSASASALQGPMGGVASRISALTSVAGGAAGPLAIMAIGITAIAAAAYATVTALLSLAKSAADFAGEIYDLSQKTNFSTETLSALGAAAKFSGSTLDALIPSLGIFQVNMVKAAEGGNAMSKVFKRLNIDTTDQERALRQAISALYAMGQTEKQTTEAKKLFGRAGMSVLGIVKETNGNLDEAIKKYDQLGFIIKDQAAAAADQFGDQLEVLSMQFTALGRTIGLEILPVLTVFMEDMSQALTGSRENWGGWADFVKAQVLGVLAVIEGMAIYVSSLGNISPGSAFMIAHESLAKRADEASMVAGVIAAARRTSAGGDRTASGGSGGKAKKSTFVQDAQREAALVQKETLQLIAENIAENERALAEQARDIEEFTKRAIKLADDRLNATIDKVNAENTAFETALAKRLITQKEYDTKDRELKLETAAAVQKNNDEIYQLERERDRKISEAQLAAKERELRMIAEADKRLIDYLKRQADARVISESEAERKIGEIQLDAFDRTRKALELESTAYATTVERRAAIVDELIRLDGERAESAEETSRRIVEALRRENNPDFPGGAIAPYERLDRTIVEAPESPPPPDFQPWITAFEQVKGVGLDAMGSLTQGIGSMVQAWVLYGNAGPNAVRKMVASVLAGLAAQAAIEALMELAKGFAALANPLMAWTAPMHFKAAAMFGLVAGGAAIAGRLVAGNSFSQGAGGGGGASGGGGAATSTAPSSIDVGRRKSEGIPVINITVVGQATDGFKYMVEKAAIESVRSNGPMRRIQNGEDV